MLVGAIRVHVDPIIAALDDLGINALLLAIVVDRDVTQDAERKLSDLAVFLLKDFPCVLLIEDVGQLCDGLLADEAFNTNVAESDVNECFQEMDQVF